MEVDISNPTTIPIKVERLTLEGNHVGDPSLPVPHPAGGGGPSGGAPGGGPNKSQLGGSFGNGAAAWKPSAVALWMPPGTKPTKVRPPPVPTSIPASSSS